MRLAGLAGEATRIAARVAERRRRGLAARLREAAPSGVVISEESESVVLAGRGLRRRLVAEATLRWLVERVRR